jgi:phthiocerol/phenolphthiocerol synthesis type-I polyketide synthase E
MKKRTNKKDIAIIGMAGKFPKSPNKEIFWERIMNGEVLSQFYTNEELAELGVEQRILEDKSFVKVDGLLENSESFDYSFFGYTKNEASLMDPQIRILHEQVWLALEDANCTESFKKKIGLFLSASDNFNWRAYSMVAKNEGVNPFLLGKISDKNFISSLISYSLNLKGPSYYLDTACSSSLVSVHLACRALLMKECSVAIAGGISVRSTTGKGYFYQEGMISSKDGYCKAFDAESSGTIGGEGAGVVVLKRLEDALNDNDHIYSVIKASAVNNDGRRKVGYAAPSITGQSECVKMAHKIAGISANQVSYIEAHGTGTKLGDSIEIEALNKAFDYDTEHKCAIGSVKTNMGHLDAAAGIAGLIKTTLAIKNELIPASLHYNRPNPEVNFESGPFYVNTKLKKWINDGEKPLYAGVSSFGIGGTNAHVILEEFLKSKRKTKTSSRPYQLLLYSAKTSSAKERFRKKLHTFISRNTEIHFPNLCYSLSVGRKSFRYRDFIVCRENNEAVRQLCNKGGNTFPENNENRNKNVVFMFSGQGSQYFEMAKEIYEEEGYFRSVMDEGFQILLDKTGEDYSEIIGYKNSEFVDQNAINNTRYTQPLLFLIEYAFARLLLHWGISPNRMIGHSLGEYVAACISGVFSFKDGVSLVVKRAQLMCEVSEGTMVAVGAPANIVRDFLSTDLSVAAINTINSCVVSGNHKSMSALMDVLSKKEVVYSKLKTSHAFHSQMMNDVVGEFEKELSGIKLSSPKIPFISNLSGKEILTEEAISWEYWKRHLIETVNFSDGLTGLLKYGNSIFIEVGPGKTLSTFLKQHKDYNSNSISISVLRHAKEKSDDNQILTNALGQLWCHGIDIDWGTYYENDTRSKISAPSYSFEKTDLPVRVDPFKDLAATQQSHEGMLDSNKKNGTNEWNEKIHIERSEFTAKFSEPSTETERKLSQIFEEFFGVTNVGINDDFFELGGDSLKAMTLVKQIHKFFDIEVDITDFFQYGTIKKLARIIDNRLWLIKVGKTDNSIII